MKIKPESNESFTTFIESQIINGPARCYELPERGMRVLVDQGVVSYLTQHESEQPYATIENILEAIQALPPENTWREIFVSAQPSTATAFQGGFHSGPNASASDPGRTVLHNPLKDHLHQRLLHEWAHQCWFGNYSLEARYYAATLVATQPPGIPGLTVDERWAEDVAACLDDTSAGKTATQALIAISPATALVLGWFFSNVLEEMGPASETAAKIADVLKSRATAFSEAAIGNDARAQMHTVLEQAEFDQAKQSALAFLLRFGTSSDLSTVTMDRVDLAFWPLGNAQLPKLTAMKHIRYLNLAGTRLAQDGFEFLAELPNLISLDLSNTKVRNSTVYHLRQLPVEELNLSGTEIDDGAVASLGEMPSLLMLDLSNTRVSRQSMDLLQTAHPNCSIAT